MGVQRDEAIPVRSMFGLFIDKDFVEIGVSQDGVLAVAYNQSGDIGFGKRPSQGPNRRGAKENIADIIIAYNQNSLDLGKRNRGLCQRPALVDSEVE